MGILPFILEFAIATFLLCGILLWMRRNDGDRSRRFLYMTWLTVAAEFTVRLIIPAAGGNISGDILPVYNLSGGLLAITILFLYPVEVINPGWLTFRRALLFSLPWVLVTLSLKIFASEFIRLDSFSQFLSHLTEFNVWIRLAILLFVIGAYCILLLFVPHNWKRSSASDSWIRRYTLAVGLIAVLYSIFMFTGSAAVSCIHLAVCSVFCFTITYQELFIRFQLPREVPDCKPEIPKGTIGELLAGDTDLLMQKLLKVMETEEIWRSPDMNETQLATILGTNTKYLSMSIRKAGFANYSDFINSRRIDEFLRMADEGKITSVQDAFFIVGFRSKATALRCFRKRTETTPSQYLKFTGDI